MEGRVGFKRGRLLEARKVRLGWEGEIRKRRKTKSPRILESQRKTAGRGKVMEEVSCGLEESTFIEQKGRSAGGRIS